jgi:hypothetical protein
MEGAREVEEIEIRHGMPCRYVHDIEDSVPTP